MHNHLKMEGMRLLYYVGIGILTERDVVSLLYTGVDLDEKTERFARKPLIVASGVRTISYALSLMIENNIRRLMVVDRSENFLGVVTQKHLLNHLEEDFYRSSLRVKHIFDQLKDLVSATQKDAIRDVLEKMVEHKISAVPIIENGIAVGIITEKDVLLNYSLKTARYTFDCPLVVGAILAGASRQDIRFLSELGLLIGQAFQIQDDIIGIYETQKNIGKSIEGGQIPVYVERFGSTKEEIFVTAPDLKNEYGADYDKIPTGAIGVYTYTERLAQGLQQLMCGNRKFKLDTITRDDILH